MEHICCQFFTAAQKYDIMSAVMMLMNNYKTAVNVMNELFSKDYQFALATSFNNTPSLRYVDTCFDNGDFYVVTYANTNKVRDISVNPTVALCSRNGYSFNGKAYNIGHPLLPENSAIREKLINAFEAWYFKRTRIEPDMPQIQKNGTSAHFLS